MTSLLLQCALLVTLVSTFYSARAYDVVPKIRSAMAPQYGALNDEIQQNSGMISSVGLNQRPFPSRPINSYGASTGAIFDQKRLVQTSPTIGYGMSSGLSRDLPSYTQSRPSFNYGMSSSVIFDQKPAIQQGPSPCSPATVGHLIPNPADRSSYIACLDETRYEIMACPDQLVFNDALDRCERISDDEAVCQQNPCMNGGQCYATSPQTFKCTCLESFTGERCEVPIGSCARRPCGPDAECWSFRAEDYPQDYVCVCNDRQSYGLSCSQTVPNPCVQESNELTQYYPFGFSKQAYVQCNGEISYFRPCPSGLLWSQEERVCKSPFVQVQQDFIAQPRVNMYQQQPRPQYDSIVPQNSYGSQISDMGGNRVLDIGQQSFDQQRKTHRHHKLQHFQKPRVFNDVKIWSADNQRQDGYSQRQQPQPVLSSVINRNSYQSPPSSSGYTSSLVGQNDIVGRRVNSVLFNNQVQQPQVQASYRRKRQYSQRSLAQKLPVMDVTSQKYGSQQSYGNQYQQPQIQSLADISIQQQPVSSGYGSSSPQLQLSSFKTNFQSDRPSVNMLSYEQLPSAQIQVTFADQQCQGQQPETVLPHPATTRKFIICLDMAKGVEQDCPSGLHYSTTSGRCERRAGQLEAPCALNPCLNGGQCTEDGSTYKCDCPQGLGGKQCELDVRTCLQSPCGQGRCQSFRVGAALTHVCICEGDTYGPTCSQTLPNPCRQDDSLPLGYTDKGFIMCDGNRFLVEGCPGGLVWDVNEKACFWPETQLQGVSYKGDVQRPLSDVVQQQGYSSQQYSKPRPLSDVVQQQGYSSQQYSNQRPSLDLISPRITGFAQPIRQEKLFMKRQPMKLSFAEKQRSFSDINQQQVPTYQQSYRGSQLQPLADISTKQQQPLGSEYDSSTILRQNDMMPSSQVSSFGSSTMLRQNDMIPSSQVSSYDSPTISRQTDMMPSSQVSSFGSSTMLRQNDMMPSSQVSSYDSPTISRQTDMMPSSQVSSFGSSTMLRQNDMMPSSQLPSSNQFVQQSQSVPQSQQPLPLNSAYGK